MMDTENILRWAGLFLSVTVLMGVIFGMRVFTVLFGVTITSLGLFVVYVGLRG